MRNGSVPTKGQLNPPVIILYPPLKEETIGEECWKGFVKRDVDANFTPQASGLNDGTHLCPMMIR